MCEILCKSEVFEIDMIFWRGFSFHFSSFFSFDLTNFATFITVPTLILRDIYRYIGLKEFLHESTWGTSMGSTYIYRFIGPRGNH